MKKFRIEGDNHVINGGIELRVDMGADEYDPNS
jgi:hypothetical protein